MKRAGPALVLAALLACDQSGSGCTDCAGSAVVPYPDPPPPGGEIQAAVVSARLTQNVLEFLRTHLPALLGSFFTVEDGYAVYYLDEALFDPLNDPIFIRDACIGEPDDPCVDSIDPEAEQGPTYPSKISFDVDGLADALELEWIEPDSAGRPGIHFAIRDFDLFVDLALVINLPDLTGVAACHVQDQPGLAALQVREMSFDLRLGIDDGVSPPTFVSDVENIVVDLGDAADDSALNLAISMCDGSADPLCADPRCEGAWPPYGAPDCAGVCGLLDLFSQLGGFLTQVLDPLMQELGPSLAGAVSDALVGALAGVPLGVETDLDLAEMAGALLGDVQPIHIKLAASPDLGIAGTVPGRGLDLGLDAGVASAELAACVAETAPPDFAHGPAPNYSGFIEVFDGESSHFELYHVAAGVSEAMVNQFFWAAHQSGLLCLDLDAYDIAELTDNAFALTGGLLMSFDARLVGLAEDESPLLLAVRAPNPPTVRIGAGGAVTADLDDPLIEVGLNDVEISIYMHLDDQYLRLTGILTDIIVRLGVERTPNNALELVLDGIDIADERQVYNELAPGADLSNLLALIVDLAVGQLLGDSLRFEIDLTDAIGSSLGVPLYLRLNDLRRDYGPEDNAYLSLFLTICDDTDIANVDYPSCFLPDNDGRDLSPAVRLHSEASLYVAADPERFPPDRWLAAPSGRARLEVDARPETAYEHQARVDGGPWSSYRTTDEGILDIDSPRLFVLGGHRIEVRSRLRDNYLSRGAAMPVSVLVDRERPGVELWRAGDTVFVEVNDIGSPDAVEIFSRIDDEPWQRASYSIDVTGTLGTLEVVARDLAGNLSQVEALALGERSSPDPATVVTQADATTGCASAPALPLAALVLVVARRRRRR